MRTIYKYRIPVEDTVTVEMPRGAVIVHVASDRHGTLAVWAIVDTGQPGERRAIYVRGTGHPLPDARSRYIATVEDGPLVWHVFEPMQPAMRNVTPVPIEHHSSHRD